MLLCSEVGCSRFARSLSVQLYTILSILFSCTVYDMLRACFTLCSATHSGEASCDDTHGSNQHGMRALSARWLCGRQGLDSAQTERPWDMHGTCRVPAATTPLAFAHALAHAPRFEPVPSAYSSTLSAAAAAAPPCRSKSVAAWSCRNSVKPSRVRSASPASTCLFSAVKSVIVGNPSTVRSGTSFAVPSILAIVTLPTPAKRSPSCSYTGASCLQWPHHGAYTSSRTSLGALTISSKVSPTTTTTAPPSLRAGGASLLRIGCAVPLTTSSPNPTRAPVNSVPLAVATPARGIYLLALLSSSNAYPRICSGLPPRTKPK
mmetsp:Transcript_6037/g.13295  ORF Transcript_6037/g.13295 Transcript_6037/m.13295 type:complete len:319 (+) Transcript_6037:265-1221(+)